VFITATGPSPVPRESSSHSYTCKSMSSGLWRRAVLLWDTNVSEDHDASIFMVKCPEDRGSMVLWNVGIPPQHYTASQPRRPRF